MKRLCICLPALLLMTLGCSRAPLPGHPQVMIENALQRTVAVTDVYARETPGGFIEVEVAGRNVRPRQLPLQYKVEFFDQDGFGFDTVMDRWTRLVVSEGAPFQVRAVSPHPAAADFRILIRKAR